MIWLRQRITEYIWFGIRPHPNSSLCSELQIYSKRYTQSWRKDMPLQIKEIPMKTPVPISDTITILKSLKSFMNYDDTMLPSNLSTQKIVSALKFISPQIIIIHGSYASKIRYSMREYQDFDIIIASIKIPFWTKSVLHKETQDRLSQLSKLIKFDVSLVTPHGLLAHIYGKTSLGQSILQGFTILYPGERNEFE